MKEQNALRFTSLGLCHTSAVGSNVSVRGAETSFWPEEVAVGKGEEGARQLASWLNCRTLPRKCSRFPCLSLGSVRETPPRSPCSSEPVLIGKPAALTGTKPIKRLEAVEAGVQAHSADGMVHENTKHYTDLIFAGGAVKVSHAPER